MKLLWLMLQAILLGILFIGCARAATCTDCLSCTNAIRDAPSGGTVELSHDINNYNSGTCISFNGKDNIIFDCQGHTIDGTDSIESHGIVLLNSQRNTVRNCMLTDFNRGIITFASNNNTFVNIIANSNYDGLGLIENYSSIVNITANYNSDVGLYLGPGLNNTIANVTTEHNSIDGIWLTSGSNYNTLNNIKSSSNGRNGLLLYESNSNRVTNLTASGNLATGVYFQYASKYNTINNSRIENSGEYGIFLLSGTSGYPNYNSFYNNYISNSANFGTNDATNNQPNYFNATRRAGTNIIGGSYVGGNYWANPSGTGFSQTCTDSSPQDGICDSPNPLSTGNVDNLPLYAFVQDITPPSINFAPPTSQNNTNVTGSYVEVNVSLSEAPNICLLDWYSGAWANYTMAVQGRSCYRNMTGLPNYMYRFMVYGNDSAGNMNVSETRQNGVNTSSPDTVPPTLTILSPANNSQTNLTWIFINVTANEPLSSCKIDWSNGTVSANVSMAIEGSFCWINKTSLPEGAYVFRVYGNDTSSNWNVSETRYATVNFSFGEEPQANPLSLTYYISQKAVKLGNSILLAINVSSNSSLDKILLVITLPNSTVDSFPFTGNATINYTPSVQGVHSLSIFANDTQGYSRTVTGNFTAANTIKFNCSVMTYNSTAIPSKIEFYYPGTGEKAAEFTSSGAYVNQEILEQNYDMLFKTYEEDFQVTLMNVNISQNVNNKIGFDHPTISGYPITYAVNNSYAFAGASVRIYYSGIHEDHIGLYECEDWSFSTRKCLGTWNSTTYSQDKNNEFILFDTNSFSAFSLKQEPFCGDQVCQADEGADNCSDDCVCTEGEKSLCGFNKGECHTGKMTCHNGQFGDCIGAIWPVEEVCDGLDNDCDGKVDDVDNGTSVAASKCQCYGGRASLDSELCNGIDDDCDGEIDNGADCCAEGETGPCGTSSTVGACHPGIKTCTNGVFGECIGAVLSSQEICNDGIDNDCNGLTDEADPACIQSLCSNGEMDGDETGIDCGGSCADCQDFTLVWISISVAGAVILGVLLFLYFKLRKNGKELTWEELMRKWTPA